MVGKPAIRLRDKPLVNAFLVNAGLVACDEDDRLAFRVEDEGSAPFAVGGRETHLLHICVLRALERIDIRPTKPRAILGKEPGDGQQFGLDRALESQKLCLERVRNLTFRLT